MNWLRTAGLRLLLSIGLGFSLWIFVSFTVNPDQTSLFQGVPVDVAGLDPNIVVVDQQGLPRENRSTVNISVEGDSATLQRVQQSDLRAFVDLNGLGPGDYSNIPVSVVPNRTGLARLQFTPNPELLSFRLEQIITNTIPLTVEVTGNVPFSFETGKPSLTSQNQNVANVQVRGPQSRVERVKVVRATVNVSGLTANFNSPRPVEPLDEGNQVVTGVTVLPDTVNVQVPIVSSAGVKRVPILPNIAGSPGSGFIVTGVSTEPQFVRLTGSAEPLDNVASVGTADIRLNGATRTFTATVALRPPANTSLASGEPDTATVRISIAPIAGTFQIRIPVSVQVVNTPGGLLASLNTQTVQLALRGDAARLSSINASDIVGNVSAADRGPGVYTIEPSFQLPAGVSLAGAPPSVTLTLRAPATPVPTTAPTSEATPGQAPTNEAPTSEAPTETPTVELPAETPTVEPAAATATATP